MSIRNLIANPFVAGLLVVGCSFVMCVDDAEAQRRGGGGGRGGGASASRGGGGGGSARAGSYGGRTAQSSVSSGNRGGSNRGSSSRGGGDRGGNSGGRNVERNGGDRTRTSGDRTNNIGSNNNISIEGGDRNINVEGGCCGYGGGWGYRHPIAAGVTIGAIAGMTAAAIGSYYYALPPCGCTVVVQNGVQYHQCGSAYYSEAMNGDEVVYVSVNP